MKTPGESAALIVTAFSPKYSPRMHEALDEADACTHYDFS